MKTIKLHDTIYNQSWLEWTLKELDGYSRGVICNCKSDKQLPTPTKAAIETCKRAIEYLAAHINTNVLPHTLVNRDNNIMMILSEHVDERTSINFTFTNEGKIIVDGDLVESSFEISESELECILDKALADLRADEEIELGWELVLKRKMRRLRTHGKIMRWVLGDDRLYVVAPKYYRDSLVRAGFNDYDMGDSSHLYGKFDKEGILEEITSVDQLKEDRMSGWMFCFGEFNCLDDYFPSYHSISLFIDLINGTKSVDDVADSI